jgi:RNA recognition motif-containing protein
LALQQRKLSFIPLDVPKGAGKPRNEAPRREPPKVELAKHGVHKVFVSDITPAVTAAVLTDCFSKFGALDDVRIVSDGTEKHRGYGFVVYSTF